MRGTYYLLLKIMTLKQYKGIYDYLINEHNYYNDYRRLTKGVDTNIRHPLGWTALHTAVINNNMR